MSETCGGSGAHNKTIVLRGTVKPKQTNADRIRAMDDEELAEFLYHAWNNAAWCSAKDCADDESCFPCWLGWLKQEVHDG